MANGTRLTAGFYRKQVIKARGRLYDSLVAENVQLQGRSKAAFDESKKALDEYKAARQREIDAKQNADSLI